VLHQNDFRFADPRSVCTPDRKSIANGISSGHPGRSDILRLRAAPLESDLTVLTSTASGAYAPAPRPIWRVLTSAIAGRGPQYLLVGPSPRAGPNAFPRAAARSVGNVQAKSPYLGAASFITAGAPLSTNRGRRLGNSLTPAAGRSAGALRVRGQVRHSAGLPFEVVEDGEVRLDWNISLQAS